MSATVNYEEALANHPQAAGRLSTMSPEDQRATVAKLVRLALHDGGAGEPAEALAILKAYETGSVITAEEAAEARTAALQAEEDYYALLPPENSDEEEKPGAEAMFRKRMALAAVLYLAEGDEPEAVSYAVSTFDNEARVLAKVFGYAST